MQLRPLPNRTKPIADIYLWTAAKEENVQNIIKMQTELDVTLNKFYLKKKYCTGSSDVEFVEKRIRLEEEE